MTNTELRSPIIEIIKDKRKSQKLTQEDLAAKAGVSKYTYRQFENHASDPSIELIAKMASALGLCLTPNVLLPSNPESFKVCSLPSNIRIGDTFYKWSVLGPARMDKFGHAHLLCECECHTISYVELNRMRQGKSTSCGCDRKAKIAKAIKEKSEDNPPGPKEDLRGQIFGNLLVLDNAPRKVNGKWEWYCRCLICGNKKWFRGTKLKSGEIQSCGCQRGKVRKAPDLAGKQFGFLKVGKMQKVENGRTLVRCRCRVCGKYKYVRPDQLLDHTVVSCTCAPRKLSGITIDNYSILDETRKNEGFPEIRCWDNERNCECWVQNEKIMRLLAEKILKDRTHSEI